MRPWLRSTPRLSLTLAGILLVGTPLLAQHDPSHHAASPYAHQGETGIASLSPEELSQLENGEGMGLARPAELHSYPGPKHVLELASELRLSQEKALQIRALFDAMHADAVRIGAAIVEKERYLDMRFDHRHMDEALLRQLTEEIAQLQGELRFTHLKAHLATAALLSAEEIAAYDRLRGYTGES